MKRNQVIEKTFRAFIAIDLPADTKEEIASLINSLRKLDKTTHWASTEKLHLTLKFLGNITQTQSNEIIKLTETIIQQHDRFDIEFNKLLFFPSEDSQQTITLSATPITPLASLAIEIDQALSDCGIAPDKKGFKPHLTIGKIKTKKFTEPNINEKIHIKFEVKEVLLFESELSQHDSNYIPIRTFSLGE